MIKKMLLIAALILGAVFVAPAAAQASYSDCAAFQGTVCFHQHANFTGAVWRQYPSQIIGCRDLTDDGWNDRASTAFNSTVGNDYILYVYQHIGCEGNRLTLTGGQVIAFTNEFSWWNDKSSSLKVQYVG